MGRSDPIRERQHQLSAVWRLPGGELPRGSGWHQPSSHAGGNRPGTAAKPGRRQLRTRPVTNSQKRTCGREHIAGRSGILNWTQENPQLSAASALSQRRVAFDVPSGPCPALQTTKTMKQVARTIAVAAASVILGVASQAPAKPPGDGVRPQEVVVTNSASNRGSAVAGNGAETRYSLQMSRLRPFQFVRRTCLFLCKIIRFKEQSQVDHISSFSGKEGDLDWCGVRSIASVDEVLLWGMSCADSQVFLLRSLSAQ